MNQSWKQKLKSYKFWIVLLIGIFLLFGIFFILQKKDDRITLKQLNSQFHAKLHVNGLCTISERDNQEEKCGVSTDLNIFYDEKALSLAANGALLFGESQFPPMSVDLYYENKQAFFRIHKIFPLLNIFFDRYNNIWTAFDENDHITSIMSSIHDVLLNSESFIDSLELEKQTFNTYYQEDFMPSEELLCDITYTIDKNSVYVSCRSTVQTEMFKLDTLAIEIFLDENTSELNTHFDFPKNEVPAISIPQDFLFKTQPSEKSDFLWKTISPEQKSLLQKDLEFLNQ